MASDDTKSELRSHLLDDEVISTEKQPCPPSVTCEDDFKSELPSLLLEHELNSTEKQVSPPSVACQNYLTSELPSILLGDEVNFTENQPFPPSAFGEKDLKLNLERKELQNNKETLPYRCELCNERFSVQKHFISHIRGHLDRKMFVCDYQDCDKRYKTAHYLKTHKLVHAKGEEKSNETLEDRKIIDTIKRDNNIEMMEKRATIDTITKANNKETLGEYKIIDTISESEGVNVPNLNVTNQQDRRFLCSTCMRFFETLLEFKNHSRVVHLHKKPLTELETYSCDFCQLVFETKTGIKRHVKNRHLGNTFLCPVCSKVFVHLAALERHLKGHIDLNYSCSECGSLFKTKVEVRQHIFQMHSSESSNVDAMDVHSQSKTDEHCSDSSIFRCTECPETFENTKDLNQHLKVHSDKKYGCKICKKAFTRVHNLNRHWITHSAEERLKIESLKTTMNSIREGSYGVSPFQCEICWKSLASKYCLREHLKTHSDVRAFSCKTCGKQFKRQYHLNRHSAALGHLQ